MCIRDSPLDHDAQAFGVERIYAKDLEQEIMDLAGVVLGINLGWRQRWLAAPSMRAGGCGLGVG
eukprot:14457692-Alexandrium_andersonii.AAC.1